MDGDNEYLNITTEDLAFLAIAFLKAYCEREAAKSVPGYKAWTEAQQIVALNHARGVLKGVT